MRSGRCGATPGLTGRGTLPPPSLPGTCSQVASRAQGSARRCPTHPYGTPYPLPAAPRAHDIGPPLSRGLGWRHWGAITGPWWSLGAPARSAGRRLSVESTAGRPYEGLPMRWVVRQHISWTETALLGQFQPQTQQTGFASRRHSPLVKERSAVFPFCTAVSFCSTSHKSDRPSMCKYRQHQ
jgi:hypothetical protein